MAYGSFACIVITLRSIGADLKLTLWKNSF